MNAALSPISLRDVSSSAFKLTRLPSISDFVLTCNLVVYINSTKIGIDVHLADKRKISNWALISNHRRFHGIMQTINNPKSVWYGWPCSTHYSILTLLFNQCINHISRQTVDRSYTNIMAVTIWSHQDDDGFTPWARSETHTASDSKRAEQSAAAASDDNSIIIGLQNQPGG